MHVVATAGHVDHGKSTLVRALTGTDPDRLDEEQRRRLSIELGYCWTRLHDVGDVAFVDVPGHQRYLTTTLAGVGPVPVAMFVVAADDPWMPQAAEHLAALNALKVTHGLLVVTRSDLADPAPALARAREQLSRTTLATAPATTVSAHTGHAMDELRSLLAEVLRSVPRPDAAADVRLWVDRAFHVRGSGTVVTGTLQAGTISVGDVLAAGEDQVRVRGIETLHRTRGHVSGVARVALALGGRSPDGIGRGTALTTPGAYGLSSVVDVQLAGAGQPPARPVLHVGSAHCGTRLRPLSEGHARLSLEQPLPLRVLDRAVLRDPGDRAIWGATVLDPDPPRLRRRGSAGDRARDLSTYDGTLEAELRMRGLVRLEDLRRRGVPTGPPPEGSVAVGDWLVGPENARRLRSQLLALVRTSSTPLEPGITSGAAASALCIPVELVDALVVSPLCLDRGRVVEQGTHLTESLTTALGQLHDLLRPAPFVAPGANTLRELGLDAAVVAALHRSGHLLRLTPGVVLLPGADDTATDLLARLDQPFTASEARLALGTSRRVIVPLLEYLDSSGRTVRLPDDRRRVRGAEGP